MEIIDYNGEGRWTLHCIRERYSAYVDGLHVTRPRDLIARHHKNGDRLWIYPVMEAVIEGIEAGDAACAELGVDFIEEEQHFPFGLSLKSNVARALRRASLSEDQKERIRKHVIEVWLHSPRYPRIATSFGRSDWDAGGPMLKRTSIGRMDTRCGTTTTS